MRRLHQMVAIALGLLLLYTLALGARRGVLEAQYRKLGDDLPFTLESALHYRRVKMIYDTGRLPVVDVLVQYPEGLNTRTSYNLGSEYVYAGLARCFPDSGPFANRLRWIEAGWFSLGIPLLALWLGVWRRNWWAAGVGASFYAVALSSVMRSTGQELSRENFALPILIAHFLADAWCGRSGRPLARVAWQILSALLLALALCSWDLIQYIILLRMAWVGGRVVLGRLSTSESVFADWLWQVGALLVVGILNPYYRAHGWLLSPAMLMAYATLVLAFVRYDATSKCARWLYSSQRRALFWCSVVALGFLVAKLTPYGDAYGHFGELIWAKVRHLNHKPLDPTVLTFDQRIMWVPALHSATLASMRMLFPCILYLTIPAFLLTFWSIRKRVDHKVGELLFFFGSSFITCWFFARFHVYLSLLACVLLGIWADRVAGYRAWARWLCAALIGVGFMGELEHTLRRPEQWGRVNVYYKELDELADWLRQHASPDPVLANFGVSAYIAAYGKCAILLHPKFEDQTIRRRVREYGELLFKGTEETFRDWADDAGARYYVYAFGEFARESTELQMRYFVNAMDPPDTVPARLFDSGRRDLTYFHYLWSNHKYAVYKILTRADEVLSLRASLRAEKFFQAGDLGQAETEAVTALRLNPGQLRAGEVLSHVSSLRESGFEHQPVRE